MHDIDRHTEAQTFFRWLKEQIIEKQADTLIVAGDVFDTANPSVEARRLYYTFLASLVDSCCKNVIIVGGNHDSAIMLDSAKELLEVLNIRVVGSINNLAPEDMCFELRGADDTINGICMAVPFMREVELRNVLSSRSSDTDCTLNEVKTTDGDLYSLAYKKVYTDIFSAAKRLRSKRNIPIIATGHLYAAELEGRLNGVASNVKTDDGVKVLDVLGTLGNVPPAVFPPADYVALGHIHYTTMVAKNPAVRYSGSPFVMGFDEAALAHYVLCVDIAESGGTVLVEKLETPQPFVYRRLSGTLAEIKAELQRLLVLGGAVKPIYLELCYQREFGVNAQDFLDDTIRALPEHITVVSWKITEQEKVFSAANGFEQFEAAEIKNLDDKEIFTQLILTKSGLDGASEEGKRAVETFLPLLMQIAGEV